MKSTEAGQSSLLLEKRVLVCCGAGGVGKTTVSAGLAIAAARAGRRVLVVTIDPSRRLAETLGVKSNLSQPVSLPEESLTKAGITPPGSLFAWVLDPQIVSDGVVRRLISNPDDAESLLANRIYRNVTAMVAGMQEYAAIEALHGFVVNDAYDLVVLDTPPSRNALRFLDAPTRARSILDSRVLSLLVPEEGNLIRQFATRLFEEVLDLAFGRDARVDIQSFFKLFGRVLGHANKNQEAVQEYFRTKRVGFLLVTSPAREALSEAYYFEKKTREELGLNLCGYILNRSTSFALDRALPDPSSLPAQAPAELRRALAKLMGAAETERDTARRHAELAEELRGRKESVWVLPAMPTSPTDMAELGSLGDLLGALMSDPETKRTSTNLSAAHLPETGCSCP